mgnify:CR=1 FL=1
MTDLTMQKPSEPIDDQTETRILRAARAVFVRRGTAGARMQEIAHEAGVNQALLHYYFRTKERLADAVFRNIAGRIAPTIAVLLASDATLEQKVERFVHLYIDNVREHPFLPAYVIAELHHHPERLKSLVASARVDQDGDFVAASITPLARQVLAKLGSQLDERAANGTMRQVSPEQFLVDLVALCVIPFVVQPVLESVLGMDGDAFQLFLDERRKRLPAFILDALRP